jgi:hypothetical protein
LGSWVLLGSFPRVAVALLPYPGLPLFKPCGLYWMPDPRIKYGAGSVRHDISRPVRLCSGQAWGCGGVWRSIFVRVLADEAATFRPEGLSIYYCRLTHPCLNPSGLTATSPSQGRSFCPLHDWRGSDVFRSWKPRPHSNKLKLELLQKKNSVSFGDLTPSSLKPFRPYGHLPFAGEELLPAS